MGGGVERKKKEVEANRCQSRAVSVEEEAVANEIQGGGAHFRCTWAPSERWEVDR